MTPPYAFNTCRSISHLFSPVREDLHLEGIAREVKDPTRRRAVTRTWPHTDFPLRPLPVVFDGAPGRARGSMTRPKPETLQNSSSDYLGKSFLMSLGLQLIIFIINLSADLFSLLNVRSIKFPQAHSDVSK